MPLSSIKGKYILWIGILLFLAILTIGITDLGSKTDLLKLRYEASVIDKGLVLRKDNLPNYDRFVLGRKLFFDESLSLDNTISCASCHLPERAFSDDVAISPGIKGHKGFRNSPSLVNVGHLHTINKDGGIIHLDLQAATPIEDPEEMGLSIVKLIGRLRADQDYRVLARKAYQRDIDAYVITRALGTYCRSIISGNSQYDKHLAGEKLALNDNELAGMRLFHSDSLGCASCHNGIDLTDHSFAATGLSVSPKDIGRARVTAASTDRGKFRVPSLRNCELTAPYMHDGSISSLEEVIDFFADHEKDSTNLDSRIRQFNINEKEKMQLKAFLQTLTDSTAQNPPIWLFESDD